MWKIFKSKKLKEQEGEVAEKMREVVFFPGTQEQYEAQYGHRVKVLETGSRDKGVVFGATDDDPLTCRCPFDVQTSLAEQGIEALVNCSAGLGGNNMVKYHRRYGLPVGPVDNKGSAGGE